MDSDDNQKYTRKTIKVIRLPILSFNRSQEAALQNSNILTPFYGNLGETMEAQKGIPLDYSS